MPPIYISRLQCAKEAGCGLEVVNALSTHDSVGARYDIGLAGEHQRVNAGLALRLCIAWMEAKKQKSEPSGGITPKHVTNGTSGISIHAGERATAEDYESKGVGGEDAAVLVGLGANGGRIAFSSSAEVHRGLSGCVWPGRCQVR